ncbi:MAG: dihydropteroate synthase [Lentisphaerae bacterium]|nr:dihydropteroate synthase [Lentisphaerota bacterium]
MSSIPFAVIAEKIHCTRVFKRGGAQVKVLDNGAEVVVYKSAGKECYLPIPDHVKETAGWKKGSVKHCAVAMWQGVHGDAPARQAGIDYLQSLARSQEKEGGTFLDINVDEFSTDIAEREQLIRWVVGIVQQASTLPMSIDSSNMQILRAGLGACDRARGKPMINSVSLEREEAVALAAEFEAAVVASAAGKERLPANTEERLQNLGVLIPKLQQAGIALPDIHIDPLVFPISTDMNNGKSFIEAVAAIRRQYGPTVHITGGLSNVSFGMPARKLINQVFTWLAVQAGADSGIVDPAHINGKILSGLDPKAEDFELARAMLMGEDEYGMNFITATRDGRIQK